MSLPTRRCSTRNAKPPESVAKLFFAWTKRRRAGSSLSASRATMNAARAAATNAIDPMKLLTADCPAPLEKWVIDTELATFGW